MTMRRQNAKLSLFVILMAVVLLSACGPEETPEQRLERIRYNHEIYPIGTTTLFGDEGEPSLMVDVMVANQGSDPLSHLTVLVQVRGSDGTEKVSQRVTLDLGDLRPGVGMQIGATVPGVALGDADEVTVELEHGLAPEDLRQLPEWADVN
jgi:hypothetical protein